MEYSIVIPAYNESARITSSLTQVINFMNSSDFSYEIIVIDDASTDNTVNVVEEYIKDNPHVKLIKNPRKGKGFTVRTGVLASSGDYIYMADADMATPIEELKRLMVWVKDHDYDLVIGSREGVGAIRKGEPFYRHIMGRIFNIIIQILILPGISDTQCGFKIFKSKVAKDIFSRFILFGDSSPIISRPRVTAFDVEMLVIARRLGYKIKTLPVIWNYHPSSSIHPLKDSLANLADVLKIKFNDIKGNYREEFL